MSTSLALPMLMLEDLSKFLTTKEAAKKASVTKTTILNDIHSGKLKADREKNRWRIQKEDFTAYIQKKSRIEIIRSFLQGKQDVHFFTLAELAELFNVVYTTIRRWINEHFYFSATRIGGRIYVSRYSVERFIRLNPKKLVYMR